MMAPPDGHMYRGSSGAGGTRTLNLTVALHGEGMKELVEVDEPVADEVAAAEGATRIRQR